jgi:hypothetical protein
VSSTNSGQLFSQIKCLISSSDEGLHFQARCR